MHGQNTGTQIVLLKKSFKKFQYWAKKLSFMCIPRACVPMAQFQSYSNDMILNNSFNWLRPIRCCYMELNDPMGLDISVLGGRAKGHKSNFLCP